jgi:hypothetical protein
MSDKGYRGLIIGMSIIVIVVLGLFLGKTLFGQKSEPKEQRQAQVVLVPKAPSERRCALDIRPGRSRPDRASGTAPRSGALDNS